MNIFDDIRTLIIAQLEEMVADGVLPAGFSTDGIAVESPRDTGHGDIATNAAMVLAKLTAKTPRKIAADLVARLKQDARISAVDIAGPGFINIRLRAQALHACVRAALDNPDFGRPNFGAGSSVNVEYVSANPTGPLHVGHVRGAVFGDALARLLEYAGFSVTRDYYINDAGAQVDALARSTYQRYLQAHGLQPDFGEDGYPGDYLIPVGQALKEEKGALYLDKPEAEWLEDVRRFSVAAMMELIEQDLACLGIHMDVFCSEKSLVESGKIDVAFEKLNAKGLIYRGVLAPPKGKILQDWEPREQTLFRSTDYGDDRDRPIKKADGSWTYFAPDIAYHDDKIQRGFDTLINVFGADHGGYVKRMTAAVAALSEKAVSFDIKLVQIVRLLKDSEPLKMSKRAGNFVLLRALVEEVGADVVRFVMLTRRNDAPLDFDFKKVLDQSRDNPVFYVQYAHARIKSALKKVTDIGVDSSDEALAKADFTHLEDPDELALALKVGQWPRFAETAARSHEPHRIAFFLYDLASELHSHWARGNSRAELRFIQADDLAATQAKIALIRAVNVVISAGLGILGVTPADEMR